MDKLYRDLLARSAPEALRERKTTVVWERHVRVPGLPDPHGCPVRIEPETRPRGGARADQLADAPRALGAAELPFGVFRVDAPVDAVGDGHARVLRDVVLRGHRLQE